MEKVNLEALLRAKKEESETQNVDVEATREEWLKRLAELHRQIREWLAPLEQKGYLTFRDEKAPLREELLGSYEAPRLVVRFYNGRKLHLEPIGLHVIGAKGRVDLNILGRQILFLVRPDGSWEMAEKIDRNYRKLEFSKEVLEALLADFIEAF